MSVVVVVATGSVEETVVVVKVADISVLLVVVVMVPGVLADSFVGTLVEFNKVVVEEVREAKEEEKEEEVVEAEEEVEEEMEVKGKQSRRKIRGEGGGASTIARRLREDTTDTLRNSTCPI